MGEDLSSLRTLCGGEGTDGKAVEGDRLWGTGEGKE